MTYQTREEIDAEWQAVERRWQEAGRAFSEARERYERMWPLYEAAWARRGLKLAELARGAGARCSYCGGSGRVTFMSAADNLEDDVEACEHCEGSGVCEGMGCGAGEEA